MSLPYVTRERPRRHPGPGSLLPTGPGPGARLLSAYGRNRPAAFKIVLSQLGQPDAGPSLEPWARRGRTPPQHGPDSPAGDGGPPGDRPGYRAQRDRREATGLRVLD
jgi:hypothetical protein